MLKKNNRRFYLIAAFAALLGCAAVCFAVFIGPNFGHNEEQQDVLATESEAINTQNNPVSSDNNTTYTQVDSLTRASTIEVNNESSTEPKKPEEPIEPTGGTFSQGYGRELDGPRGFSYCPKGYSRSNHPYVEKGFHYDGDFSGLLERGTASVVVSYLELHSMEVDFREHSTMNVKGHCYVKNGPTGKSKIYVKPRVAVYKKNSTEVSRYEESGDGVRIKLSDRDHGVGIEYYEYLENESTGPQDAIDKLEKARGDEEKSEYYAVVDQIKVTVVLE